GLLKPGMSAEVTVIVAERPDALTLPNNAIVTQTEVLAAASVLGVPEARAQIDPAIFQEMTRELAVRRGGPAAAAAAAGDATASAGPVTPADVRARVERGEITQEEARTLIQQAMGAGAGAGRARGAGGAAGGQRARSGASAENGRPGVVFIRGADGLLTARAVLIGVNDWNNSEILMGVEEGEVVALIGGAALQARQQERNAQMQSRMGGGLPFGR
ncbi:MAG: hypothetical protein EA350_12555, partial [Gemmatimonadales bacterium]